MLQFDVDFWFDRTTWSAYMAFALLTGLVLLLFLPSSQRILDSLAAPPDLLLFPLLFIILYGILAMTLGQAEIHWTQHASWPSSITHLVARQLFALALALPYWFIFLGAHSLSLLLSLVVLLHLCLYGFVLGCFGWRLGLTRRSEIFQFNLKYLIFATYLIGSFFLPGLSYLNPLWPLDRLLRESSGSGLIGLFIQSDLLWLATGFLLALWIHRSLERELAEKGRPHGVDIS